MSKINFNTNLCDRINNELVLHLTQECPNNCCFCIDKLNKHYDDLIWLANQKLIHNAEGLKDWELKFKSRKSLIKTVFKTTLL